MTQTIKNKIGGKDTNLAWDSQNIAPKLIKNGGIAITETSSPKKYAQRQGKMYNLTNSNAQN